MGSIWCSIECMDAVKVAALGAALFLVHARLAIGANRNMRCQDPENQNWFQPLILTQQHAALLCQNGTHLNLLAISLKARCTAATVLHSGRAFASTQWCRHSEALFRCTYDYCKDGRCYHKPRYGALCSQL
jgi:hypothetical protein